MFSADVDRCVILAKTQWRQYIQKLPRAKLAMHSLLAAALEFWGVYRCFVKQKAASEQAALSLETPWLYRQVECKVYASDC